MNTSRTRIRRAFFGRSVVTLLVGIVVVLLSGSPSAQAQTNTTATTSSDVAVDSTITIKGSGTVNDPSGAIAVSGLVTVTCRRIIDTTGISPPLVVLDFDFSQLQGTSGTGKTKRVYVTGGNNVSEIRPLQASDMIIVTCPYFDSTKDALSASSFLLTATLNFDISSGKLTGGSITIGNNVITSAAVGTTASM